MKSNIGLWIDHEKAYIVSLHDGKESRTIIESDAESHHKSTGGKASHGTPYAPTGVVSEKKIQHRQRLQFKRYYQKIIDQISTANQVFIFGPGNAKFELQKEMTDNSRLHQKVKAVETADHLTENQISAKVKQYYAHS